MPVAQRFDPAESRAALVGGEGILRRSHRPLADVVGSSWNLRGLRLQRRHVFSWPHSTAANFHFRRRTARGARARGKFRRRAQPRSKSFQADAGNAGRGRIVHARVAQSLSDARRSLRWADLSFFPARDRARHSGCARRPRARRRDATELRPELEPRGAGSGAEHVFSAVGISAGSFYQRAVSHAGSEIRRSADIPFFSALGDLGSSRQSSAGETATSLRELILLRLSLGIVVARKFSQEVLNFGDDGELFAGALNGEFAFLARRTFQQSPDFPKS